MRPARGTPFGGPRRIDRPGQRARASNLVLAQRTQRHEQEAQLLAVAHGLTPVERGLGRKTVELGNSPIDQVKDCQALNPLDGRRTLGFCASCVTD